MVALQKNDVLGDAYEYLIGQFAMESGKKAGEFYTPRQVSEVMAQIVAEKSEIKSIYDPTVGSGSLLLTVKKHLKDDGYICMASPHYIDMNEVVESTPLKILEQHAIRMHKSLTRIITVLAKDR